MLDFAGTSCKDVFNSPRKVSLFIDVIDVILQHLHTSPSGRAPDADQSQEANLFVEKLLVR